MEHKNEKESLTKEFELLISDFLKEEQKDEIFWELTSSLQLYVSLEYLKTLVEKQQFDKIDEYLSRFITFVSFISFN